MGIYFDLNENGKYICEFLDSLYILYCSVIKNNIQKGYSGCHYQHPTLVYVLPFSKKSMLSPVGNTLKGIGNVMNVAESGSETWEWTSAKTK